MEDISGSFSTPDARDDTDILPAGSHGPATGNVITGAGTTSGKAGADIAAGGHVVAARGAGGSDASDSGSSLHVEGRYGVLTLDANGNYRYTANQGAPDNVRDLFQYTLANAKGGRDTADLVIELGGGAIKVDANAQRIVPGADGLITLPPGVDLTDVHVVGRDLVVNLPNGQQLIIVDGAVFVPQLVIGGVEVPASNVAELLIDSEIKPTAGPPQSSGGNFADALTPLDPGSPLGDLIPPTELVFQPPEIEEIGQFLKPDEPPTLVIETPDQPAGAINATESVNEKGLPARPSESEGSGESAAEGANGDTSEANTGTIVFSTPDGFGNVSINNIVVTGNGQQIAGQFGTITITAYNPAAGTIGYSYTLSDNTSGDATQDVFAVVATDTDGDTAAGSLTVHIIDDVPTARNDSGAQATQDASITVNVINNDTPGADSVSLTSGVALVAGSLQVSAGQTAGSVVYNNNGTFTYIPSPGQEGSVTFQYRITDGDGDTSIATVTITLLPDAVPTISVTGDQSVNEAGLPARGSESEGSGEAAAGGANGDPSETAIGTINITTGNDTVGSLFINNVNVTNGGTVNGANGVLTVTLSNGVYSYSYTLTDNSSGDATSDTFSVTVTDSDGDSASTSLVISIVDDVPTAHNDSGSQLTENAPITVNVINNDVPGADSVSLASGVALVAGTLSGAGSVVYNNNGTFTYTPGAGEQGTVTFQYRITDGDGDTSIATVTITLLADSTPTVGITGDQSVNEAGLPARAGESEGSGEAAAGGANGDTSETAVGNINITTGNDTVQSLIVGGVNVTNGGTVPGVNGTLTVTFSGGVYSYSYTLNDNTSGDATSDTFSVTVTDSDGDSATTSLVISIVDDVPTAHDDSGTQSVEDAPVTVNVINNDVPGADSVNLASGVALVAGSLSGTGSVLYNNDGTFTYTPGAGESGTVTFQYKITDGDGDTSIATVTITLLADSTPTVGITGDQSVNEAGLPARAGESEGSGEAAAGGANGDTSETAVGNINITTGNDTVGSLIVGGIDVTNGGTVPGVNGTLTVTFSAGVYSYSYTLNDNTSGDATSDTFSVKVIDSDGDSATTSLVISIVDDVPTAHNDSGSQLTENAPITVNVINNDVPGADSVSLTSGVALVAGTLSGTGSVLYNNDGTFTYTPGAGEEGTVTFQYKITDGDGDTSIATVTITLLADSTPTVGVTGDQSVNEAGLPARGSESEGSGEAAAGGANGDTTETAVGNINITTGNDTVQSLIINNVNVTGGGTVNGVNGTLTITFSAGVYSYSYTLLDNTSGDATSDTFSVKVTDSDGDSATTSLVISIVDDVPTARNDSGSQLTEDAPITVNVINNDTPGADSVSLTTGVALVPLSLTGTGSVVYNNNGTFTYTPTAGEQGTVTFQYKITDGDGDTSIATVTITLLGDSTPTVGVTGDQSVNEAGLPARGSEPQGSGEAAAAGVNGDPSETAVGNINITTGNDTLQSLIINNVNVTGGGTVNGVNGTLTVTFSAGVYSYSYTLLDNTSGDATSDTFSVKVTDSDGDSATTSLVISIVDDVPTAHNDTDSVAAGTFGPEGGNVISGVGTTSSPGGIDVVGADNAGVVSITGAGGTDTSFSVGLLSIAGTYGTLTMDANGNYNYTRNQGTPGGVTDTFSYKLQDGDGDTSSANLVISIGDAGVTTNIPPAGGATTTVFEKGLPARGSESEGSGEQAAAGANGDTSEAVSGTIGFNAIDGLGSISLGGTAIVLAGPFPQTMVTNATGTLVVTGVSYNSATGAGTISYTYTLADNTSGDTTNVSFALDITDADGDHSPAGNLVINITDDVPTANNDGITQTTENTPVTVNVIANDVPGADSVSLTTGVALVAGSLSGTGSVVYNSDGTFTYTPGVGEQGTVTFQYRITDGDGDTSVATVTITLQPDSTPSATAEVAFVDDDGLTNGNAGANVNDINANTGGDGDSNPSEAIWSGTLNASFGNDTPGSFSFANTITGTTSVLGQETVTYTVSGGGTIVTANITASPDATRIGTSLFTVTITNQATGAYTVQLLDNVLHATLDGLAGDNTENPVDPTVSIPFTATDSDGNDSTTANLTITFDDDMPSAFTPDPVASANGDQVPVIGNLNTVMGADGLGSYVFDLGSNGPGTLNNGIAAKDAQGNNLTVGGAQLFLFGDNTNHIYGATSVNAAHAFDVTLNANGTYSFDVNATISNGTETNFNDFSQAKAGNVDFRALGADVGGVGETDVLMSAHGATGAQGTVNTDSDSIGVDSNSINPGAGIRLDFVTNITSNAAQPTGFSYGTHVTTTHFEQTIAQVQGNPDNQVAIVVTAILADNDQTLDNTPSGGGIEVGESIATINKVTVTFTNGGTHVFDPTIPASLSFNHTSQDGSGTVTTSVVFNGNGTVSIIGLQVNDVYEIDTTTNFSAVIIEAPDFENGLYSSANGDALDNEVGFDAGFFSIGAFSAGTPIDQNFTIIATDADGDSQTSNLQTTIVNNVAGNVVGTSGDDAALNGNAGDNVVAGNAGNDTLNGNDGNDFLYGGAGADTLNGGNGNDSLEGGTGADQLTGGAGTDIYVLSNDVITAGSVNADTIVGYTAGEIIDITEILTQAGSLSGVVRLLANGDLQVDLDGGGNSFVTIAHITAGVNATIKYVTSGTTTTTAVIVSGAPPVVMDLNGDGHVDFLPASAGVTFDYGGGMVATAWVGPNDGILVHDANHDGNASGNEIMLAGSGTDLQALAAYDTNHDGQLSSADADFASFAVWQDANSNGVVDAGEMSSLTARGIASISLSSDGIAYSAAGGDVEVAGTGSFTYANGSTGALADAAFLIGGRGEQARSISASDGNAAILAAAVAAAGLAANAASAAGNHASGQASSNAASGAAVHNQALAPEALDSTGGAQGSSFVQQGTVTAQANAASSQSNASDQGQSHSADNSAAAQSQAPTDLLQGTDAPVHNAVVSATPMAAASVGMPAPAQAGGVVADGGPAQSNAVVAQVLADALHGGGGGPIDALINSLPGQGGSAALASHNAGGVSNGDTGVFAAFSAAHISLTMESMVVHQDAAPHA